jgi:hypothetical protein
MQALGASFAINQDKLIVSVGGRPHWIMEHYFQPTVTIENAAVLLDVERDRFQIEGVFRGTNAIRILQGISTTSANCECGCHFPQHPANLPLTNTVSLRTTLIEKRQSQCSCLDWKKVCSPISYMEEQQWNQLFEINGVFGS